MKLRGLSLLLNCHPDRKKHCPKNVGQNIEENLYCLSPHHLATIINTDIFRGLTF